MRIFRYINAKSCIQALPTLVLNKFWSGFFDDDVVPATSIGKRQVSGVVATSQFLRRAYQASTVVDNFVYIDGGDFSFFNNGTPNYEYSNTLLSVDLSQSWTNSTVRIQNIAKPEGCVSLNGPSLWYHREEGVLYSGFAGWASPFMTTSIDLNNMSIWTFTPDGTGSGAWKDVLPSGSMAFGSINRPEQVFQASGADSAWVLGGFDKYDTPNQYPYLPSMVHFNMSSRTITNISNPAYLTANGAVDNGEMHYVPSFGPQGIFIAMGGDTIQHIPGLISFGTVAVFDPAKQEWFNQTTTGSPPRPRLEFCTAGINSTNGTYEIFVYGGWGTQLGAQAVQFDSINILTLPAFHWISVPNNPQNPRIGLTCNAVGGSQILTIGGRDGNPKVVDSTHILNTQSSYDTKDPNAQGLAIFDLTNLTFSAQYTAGAPAYEQSSLVQQFYSAAQQTYNQNLTAGVAALLAVTHFTNATTSSNSATTNFASNTTANSNSNTGAIAGGTIGGVSLLALIAGSIVFYLKKRRRRRQQKTNPAEPIKNDATMAEQRKFALQEADQDYQRPAELEEGRLFEMEGRQLSEAGAGERYMPELDGRGRSSVIRT